MSGSRSYMLHKDSILSRGFTRLAFVALFFFAGIPLSSAQVILQAGPQLTIISQQGGVQSSIGPGNPPPDISINRLPARDPNAIAADGWLLYPTLRMYSLYSDNLFLSPPSPISAGGVGATPSLVAVWSNGIHTTTLYGYIDREIFPADNSIDALNGRAGFTQKYESMRDLIFSVNGSYTHQTWATGLVNSIQTPTPAPTTTVLSNGNTLLPNGTIISPTGQPVGQAAAATGSSFPVVVNPSNQYTGTFSIDKIFSRAAIGLSGSVNRTDYENQTLQPSFNSRTLTENAAIWLGPLIYAYSNGYLSTVVTDATLGSTTASSSTSTTSNRVIGGLGTRPAELFRGSVYFGHQGSDSGGTSAEGNVYGGALYYNPTPPWTISGTIDRTKNISSQQSAATNLALTLPGVTGVQIPLSASTEITTIGLLSSYQLTPRWFFNGQLFYTRVEYVDSPRLDKALVFDAILRYDIWRNMSLAWEYRYTNILSNAPLVSTISNYGIMSVTYRF
jgi:Putative beta-barrel porin 2